MITNNDIQRYTFTDGARITPIFYDGQWVWMVFEFDGDTYCDGELINPDVEANSINKLANKEQ